MAKKNNSKKKNIVRGANEQKGKLMRLYEAYCVFVELVCKWSTITPLNNPINKNQNIFFSSLYRIGGAKSCKIKYEKRSENKMKRQRWKLNSQLRVR